MGSYLRSIGKNVLVGTIAVCLFAGIAKAKDGKTSNPPEKSVVKQIPRRKTRSTGKRAPAPVRQASFGLFGSRHSQRGYVPAHLRSARARGTSVEIIEEGEIELFEGETLISDSDFDGEVIGGESVVGDCCDSGRCGAGVCNDGCLIPCPTLCFDNFEFFAGAQGATGPASRGEGGSFGFYEGFNWAAPLPCFSGCLGVQGGIRAVQSNLSGIDFADENRQQIFATLGLFRRMDWGLQGGVVVDFMYDDWYYEANLSQVRGELSWVYPCDHEIGFWFTTGLDSDSTNSDIFDDTNSIFNVTDQWESKDLFALFYRRRFDECGAEGRFFAGMSSDSDGLIGGDLRLPLSDTWAFEASLTYLIPDEGFGFTAGGNETESWNVAFGFVWYPGSRSARGGDYYRPLFGVADNGSFLVDRE